MFLSCQNHCLRENTRALCDQRRWHLQGGTERFQRGCPSLRSLAQTHPSNQSGLGWGEGEDTRLELAVLLIRGPQPPGHRPILPVGSAAALD